MTELAVQFEGVRKVYPHFTLDDIDISLATGGILGFIGANGAGKRQRCAFSWASYARTAARFASSATSSPSNRPRPSATSVTRRRISAAFRRVRAVAGVIGDYPVAAVRAGALLR
jgi:ABC-type branched-subunit amino acid transport system ATPase component